MNKYIVWKKNDTDAMLGVFFDGIPKIIAGVGIMIGVLGMSNQTVYKNILPGIGLAVALLSVYFWYEGILLAKKRDDLSVVAMPGGLVAGRFFVWLFAIMGPTFWSTKDAVLAWQVGLWAQILGGVVFAVAALVSGYLLKIIPKGALFGSLAGGALAWLFLAPIGDVFARPTIGMLSMFLLLLLYMGNFKTKLPTAIIAIGLGTIIGWASGQMDLIALKTSVTHIGFNVPIFNLSFLNKVAFMQTLKFLPIIVAFSFGEVISGIQAIEQADAGGDIYDSKRILLGTTLTSMITAFFGNPFPMGTYWGHSTWKKINAGTSYMLANGMLYLILCCTGLVAIVTAFIPVESALPLLVFIGIASAAQAFEIAEKKYYSAVILAMGIPLIELLWGKITAAAALTQNWTLQNLNSQGIATGYEVLNYGASFTGLIWGAMFCFIIDNNWKKAKLTALVGVVLSFIGVIHSSQLKINANFEITILYLIVGLTLLFLEIKKVKNID